MAANAYGYVITGAVMQVEVEPPAITSVLTATGAQGTPFSYTIEALHSPTLFQAKFLPNGLTLNTNTGVISGIPADSGTFGAPITAINASLALAGCPKMGELVFLHEVAPGAADRSYGIQVARLEGLPKGAVERARAVLARLEANGGSTCVDFADDLPLFAQIVADVAPSPLEAALSETDRDALSPKEALEVLYKLKAVAADPEDH